MSSLYSLYDRDYYYWYIVDYAKEPLREQMYKLWKDKSIVDYREIL